MNGNFSLALLNNLIFENSLINDISQHVCYIKTERKREREREREREKRMKL